MTNTELNIGLAHLEMELEGIGKSVRHAWFDIEPNEDAEKIALKYHKELQILTLKNMHPQFYGELSPLQREIMQQIVEVEEKQNVFIMIPY